MNEPLPSSAPSAPLREDAVLDPRAAEVALEIAYAILVLDINTMAGIIEFTGFLERRINRGLRNLQRSGIPIRFDWTDRRYEIPGGNYLEVSDRIEQLRRERCRTQ